MMIVTADTFTMMQTENEEDGFAVRIDQGDFTGVIYKFGKLDIKENNDNGLRSIVEAYISLNTICLPIDHFRIEEGSEHYLFYELEERLKRSFIHGNIIGLGIYLLSRLQKNDPLFITETMDESGLIYHPNSMDIKRKDLRDSLLSLKSYVKSKDKLWFTIIDDSNIDEEWINENLSDLKFK